MSRFLFLLILSSIALNVTAQFIDQAEAELIAGRFIQKTTGGRAVSIQAEPVLRSGQIVYYTFKHNSGFVIVSAEQQYEPVLAYSNSNLLPDDPEDYPPAMQAWMDDLSRDILYVREHGLMASPRARENRDKILSNQSLSQTRAVTPLLSTTWSQGCGYNAQCPVDASGPCNRVYTGCIATAQAQVMKYHAHPSGGIGSECYTHSVYGELCADFSAATYDWPSMPNSSGNAEVAELMYHCGVSVHMNYSPTGSGSYLINVMNAWLDYFDYTKNMDYVNRWNFENVDWEDLMRKECDAGRVTAYKGSGSGGHAFVLDGYDDFGAFHFNWGWGGIADGYYYMGNLNPSGHDYSDLNSAIIGTEPSSSFTGLDFSAMTSLSCGSLTPVDLSTGISYVNIYGDAYINAVGKEKVFEFTTTYPGRITINIENQSNDISVILLSHQHEDSVLSYGSNGLVYDNSLPGTYYLVLDVAEAQDAGCDLELICPTVNADIVVQDAYATPDVVESGQSNVLFRSYIKNIGNSDAVYSIVKYYLSDNDILDGGDILLGSATIPALLAGEEANVQSLHTMPVLPAAGFYNLLAVPDASDVVVETVDDDYFVGNLSIPAPGIMNCSSAYSMLDEVWYWDNTEISGDSVINNYSCGWDNTGNEMIYSFTPAYSGIAKFYFSEKELGDMNAQIFPICNENANCLTNLSIWNLGDTITNTSFYVVAGVEYFAVVDGQYDLSGDFGVMVDLPGVCPEDTLYYYGSPDLCDGDGSAFLQTEWGYSSYQWYKDGSPILGENAAMYYVTGTGEYWAEITENACTVETGHITITYSPAPDTAHIVANTDTIACFDEMVELEVDAGYLYGIQWYRDGVEIPGANSAIYQAIESGEYTADVINISCHLTSNSIHVIVGDEPLDFSEQIPESEINLKYYFPFDEDFTDGSGNNMFFNGWNMYPADGYDGGFWTGRQLLDSATMCYVSPTFVSPTVFTHAFWFKTTETDGGVLLELNNSPYGGGTPDRVLYMSDDGRLHFFVENSGAPVELSSTGTYNDGTWHHVVVTAGTYAKIRIDDGLEDITDPTALSLDSVSGYWVYGGIELPAGLSDPPSDPYLITAFDELRYYERALPWMETAYFLNDFNLDASLRFDTVCDGGDVYLDFAASQPGIQYILRNVSTGDTIATPVTGTGGAVSIGPEWMTASADLEVLALDTLSACSKLLSGTFHLEVLPTLSPEVTLDLTPGDSVCQGVEITVTAPALTAGGDNPQFEWYLNGISQGIMDEYISTSFNDDDSLSVIMTSDYYCASVLNDTADTVLTIHTLPYAGFTYPAGVCETDSFSVTYTGTTVDVSGIAWDINGTLQSNTGGGEQWFMPVPGLTTVGCTVETLYGCTASFSGPVITYDTPSVDMGDTVWVCPLNIVTLDAGTDADEYLWSTAETTQAIDVYGTEDTYYVTVTNTTGGCTATDSVVTHLYPADLIFEFPGTDTTVCIEDGFTYSLHPMYTDVVWTVDGVPVSGNSFNFAYAGDDSVVVDLAFRYPPGYCIAYDTLLVVFEVCSGLHEKMAGQFKVYPNPASNDLWVYLKDPDNSSLSLYDMTGKKVLFIQPSGKEVIIDVSSFSEGIYMLEMWYKGIRKVKRIEIVR